MLVPSKEVTSLQSSNSNGAMQKNSEVEQKPSTGKQLIVVAFILAIATKTFILPIYLIQAIGRDGYIALSVTSVIELFTLIVITVAISKTNGKNFYELMQAVTGTVIAKIITAVLGLFLFFKLCVSVTEIISFYSDTVFADFDVTLMGIVLLAFLAVMANGTLRALCRLNEIVAPVVLIGIISILALVMFTGTDLANVFPSLQNVDGLGNAIVTHLSWLGDFLPLLLFVGRTEKKGKRTVVCACVSGGMGLSLVVFQAMLMCSAFGNVPWLIDSSTNISGILQYTVGNVYGRVDMLAFILWSVAAFVKAAILFYSVTRCVELVIGRKSRTCISLILCVAEYFLLVFCFSDPTIFELIMVDKITTIVVTVVSLDVPILTLICNVVSCRKKNFGAITDDFCRKNDICSKEVEINAKE